MNNEPEFPPNEDEEENQLDQEFSLPLGAMCEHHPDEPAVDMRGGEPLCEDCLEHYTDGYKEND